MVFEVDYIKYLQLRHRSNDLLQRLECFIACADLVKSRISRQPRRRRFRADALFEDQGIVGSMVGLFLKLRDKIAAQ